MQPFAYCGIAWHAARRAAALLCALALCLPLAACGKAPLSPENPANSAVPSAAQPAAQTAEQPLTQVMTHHTMNRDGAAGFYTVEWPKNTQNLMFYDYATLQQRYLCADEACTHDHEGCTSYLPSYGGVHPFVANGFLYLNYAGYPDPEKPQEEWTALTRRSSRGATPSMHSTISARCTPTPMRCTRWTTQGASCCALP